MTAENILPIINALPEEEKVRLYAMLGVRKAEVTGPPKRPHLDDAKTTEYLVGMFGRMQQRNQKRKALRKQDLSNNK